MGGDVPVIDLYQYSANLLTAAEQCLTNAGIPLPVQRFLSPCEPDLWCCDILAVTQTDIEPDLERLGCVNPLRVFFELTIRRCVPLMTEGGGYAELGDIASHVPGTYAGSMAEILLDRQTLLTCLSGSFCSMPDVRCQSLDFVSVTSFCGGGCGGSVFRFSIRV